jgi:hypothetical protein
MRRTDCSVPSEIRFDSFRLFPARRLLLDGDSPVRIGSRALDLLIALINRRGETVSRAELIAKIWPDTVVEESNLKVQIGALRRSHWYGGQVSYVPSAGVGPTCRQSPKTAILSLRADWPRIRAKGYIDRETGTRSILLWDRPYKKSR